MSGPRRYQTPNREAIMLWFKTHDGQSISVSELSEELEQSGHPVAMSTLYRNIAQLVQEKFLMAIVEPGKPKERYVYRANRGGFMLKCEYCGHSMSLYCSEMETLHEHIASQHRFYIDSERTVFVGYCDVCHRDSSIDEVKKEG